MHKKGNVFLLLMLVIGFVIVSYVIIKQKELKQLDSMPIGSPYPTNSSQYTWPEISTEEASWEMYKDPSGVLSFKHPNDWEKKENSDTFYIVPDCYGCGGVRSYVAFAVEKNNDHLSSREYVVQNVLPIYEGDESIKVTNDVPSSISAYDITMVDGIGGAGAPGPDFYIATPEYVVVMESDGADFTILSKVLSTLEIKQ